MGSPRRRRAIKKEQKINTEGTRSTALAVSGQALKRRTRRRKRREGKERKRERFNPEGTEKDREHREEKRAQRRKEKEGAKQERRRSRSIGPTKSALGMTWTGVFLA
jgi:hypothetical protein